MKRSIRNLFLASRSPSRRVQRLALVALEDRSTPATFTVTNGNDADDGSLRAAITAANGNAGPDTIIFSQDFIGDVVLTTAELVLSDKTGATTITGPRVVTRSKADGTPLFRIFNVSAGAEATFSGLTISEGDTDGNGGGILNGGLLLLTNTTLSGNDAKEGGGFYNSNTGVVTIFDCKFSENKLTIPEGATIPDGAGGGILNEGKMTLTDSVISKNEGSAGAGFSNATGETVMTRVTISENTSKANGGGIGTFKGSTLTLNSCILVGNTAVGDGGGIGNSGTLTITNSTFSLNTATAKGGGIRNSEDGTLNMADSIFSNNTANFGGGIFNDGAVSLGNATFSGNTADTGGGIFNRAQLVLFNATLSGNTAKGGGGGFATNTGTARLLNVTVTANRADADNDGGGSGGGISILNVGTVELFNTIVAENFKGTGTTADDVFGTIDPASKNNLINEDARLGPLANNGGAAPTHALLRGSPAINAGDNAHIPAGVTVDQRNVVRVSDTNVDIGAYEVQIVTITPANLPGGTVGTAYNQPLAASFPNQPAGTTYTFTANGALPAGLTLSADGVISGTPTAGGNSAFAVVATASTGDFSGLPFTITVADTIPDGDTELVGFPQFAVGSDRGGNGSVIFYNADKSVRATVQPFGAFAGGVRTASADFNGDGIADIVAGTGPGRATRVVVIDGANQKELFAVDPFEASFTGGVYVTAGDLNGDGKADLAITPDEGGGPRVDVYSGNGFTKFASFFGIDDPNFRGGARASTGDLNGDGRADLIVVAGFGGGPRVAGFDGKSIGGTPVKIFGDFFAFEQTLRNGIFVTVGDLNGDGFADLICGGGPGGGPRVLAFSGKDLTVPGKQTQTQMANFFGGDPNSRGGIRLAVKDLDGDARADLVVGAGAGAGSRVTSYLGKSIPTDGPPSENFAFDAFAGFTGGVFVG